MHCACLFTINSSFLWFSLCNFKINIIISVNIGQNANVTEFSAKLHEQIGQICCLQILESNVILLKLYVVSGQVLL